jgi:hypothetical protein
MVNPAYRRSTKGAAMIFCLLMLALILMAISGRLPWFAALVGGALLGLPALLRSVRSVPNDDQPSRSSASSTMSRSEALDVLGLQGEPTEAQIIAAHRKLMQGVHPDRGGSTYLAQQLNEAKQTLLKR